MKCEVIVGRGISIQGRHCVCEPRGRAALLRSLNIRAAGHHRPTGLLEWFMVRSFGSRLRILCDPEPRIAEFIPPQCLNNSNAFTNTTLKRHECRAPFARFMGSLLSKIHMRCDHQILRGRAALLRSLNIRAAVPPCLKFMRVGFGWHGMLQTSVSHTFPVLCD